MARSADEIARTWVIPEDNAPNPFAPTPFPLMTGTVKVIGFGLIYKDSMLDLHTSGALVITTPEKQIIYGPQGYQRVEFTPDEKE